MTRDTDSAWRYTTVEHVASPTAHSIVDGPFGSSLKVSEYVADGVPVLQGKNITDDRFAWFDVRFISEQKAETLKRSSVREGDILVVKIGSIGYSAILDDLRGNEYAIIPANLAKITPNPEVVDTKYLHRWLTSPTAKGYLKAAASKTAQPALSLGKIRDLPLPLPPMDEQRRIVNVLDLADNLRTKRRKTIDQCDMLAQSIYFDMFGDPVGNPRGLPKKPLGELLTVKSGEFLPAKQMVKGIYPVFGGNGINGYHNQFLLEEPRVVIGRVGVYCGCVHLAPPRSWVTDNALYVSTYKEPLDATYLARALEIADLNQYASQFGQPLISGARVYPVPILVPSIEEQVRFTDAVHKAQALTEVYWRSADEMDALFVSLQNSAFRGEL
jgi:type I restriction enzyme S subunit